MPEPLKIKGYRTLSNDEIALINSIKTHGDALEQQVMHLASEGADPHWLAIGAAHLQQGLMALSRAVARPTTFG